MPDKIRELYVIMGVNEEGHEGVASYTSPDTGVMVPMIGSLKRVPELLSVSKALANVTHREFRLVKFSQRGNLDWIRPDERDRSQEEDN